MKVFAARQNSSTRLGSAAQVAAVAVPVRRSPGPLTCPGRPRRHGGSVEKRIQAAGRPRCREVRPVSSRGNLQARGTATRRCPAGQGGLPRSSRVMETESLKLPQTHAVCFQRSGMEMTIINYQVLKGFFLAFQGVRSYFSKFCHYRSCLYVFPIHRKVSIGAI